MRIVNYLRGFIAAVIAFHAVPAAAQIQLNTVVSGLSSPLFAGHAGDGTNRLFIVEQGGVIKVLQPGSSQPTVFLDITARVLTGGEQGLLGLAFHPLFDNTSNRRFFVFYTQQPDSAIVIAEYLVSTANRDVADTAERRILVIPPTFAGNHNGGMIAFGSDGYLYISVGDRAEGYDAHDNAQNLDVLLGKILRIDINSGAPYSSPSSNPFVGTAGRDEIWAYGFRNPWRFSFDRMNGQDLWVGDVGQDDREEVDAPVQRGGNYGWAIFEGTFCTGQGPAPCIRTNYVDPLFEYDHSLNNRCSVIGGYVYRGTAGTLTNGTYVYGDLCSGEIFAWNGSTQSVLFTTSLNVSSFGEDEAGELYVVNIGGTVSKIVGSAPPPPPCTYSINPSQATFPAAGGTETVTVTAGAGCAWLAETNASWITITGGSPGPGNGTVNYSVAPYTGKPKKRNGTLTIAGQTFRVTQTK